jgi:hypothetical protein
MLTLSRRLQGFRAHRKRHTPPEERARITCETLENRTLLSFPPLPVVPGPGEIQILQNALRFARNNQLNPWDNHGGSSLLGGITGYEMLKRDYGIPPLDRAYAALLGDLADRGMLDETAVVLMGEFGRTPKINTQVGRDHWGACQSILLAGGALAGRLGRRPALLVATGLQGLGVLGYVAVAIAPSLPGVWAASTIEHFVGGMATAALFTAMMDTCF